MSIEKGYIRLYRDLLEHWIWTSNEPFDKRSAWIDLILRVNYSDKKIEFNGRLTTIKRGEIITSLRALGGRWKWSTKKVSEFLDRLEKDGSIETERNTRYTRIKLVKYGFHQSISDDKETPKKHTGNTGETQKKTTKESNKGNTSNKTLSNDSVCVEGAHPRGRFKNVFLTDEEHAYYKSEVPDVDEIIDELSDAIDTAPDKYATGHTTAWLNKFIRTKRNKDKKEPSKWRTLT